MSHEPVVLDAIPELARLCVVDVHSAWSISNASRWAQTGDASGLPRRWREIAVPAAAKIEKRIRETITTYERKITP